MLEIKNLTVESGGKTILEDINFKLQAGEKLAIMGPNGSGKSSLAQTLAGNPEYKVLKGQAIWTKTNKKIDLLELEPEARAAEKLFVSFQNPPAIEGLKLASFLKEIKLKQAQNDAKEKPKTSEILTEIKANLQTVGLPQSFYAREFNTDFSGGEKKKNEILQLLTLKPDLMLLDEIDSGLDIDATKKIFREIEKLMNPNKYLILITHNPKILDLIQVQKILILKAGKVKKIGQKEILTEVLKNGFDGF